MRHETCVIMQTEGKVMIANDFKLWRAEEKDFADRNTLDLQEKYDECFDNFI